MREELLTAMTSQPNRHEWKTITGGGANCSHRLQIKLWTPIVPPQYSIQASLKKNKKKNSFKKGHAHLQLRQTPRRHNRMHVFQMLVSHGQHRSQMDSEEICSRLEFMVKLKAPLCFRVCRERDSSPSTGGILPSLKKTKQMCTLTLVPVDPWCDCLGAASRQTGCGAVATIRLEKRDISKRPIILPLSSA